MNLFEEWLNMNELQHESHQADAVKWCLQKETDSAVKGGIIADEMGLGKTIEILGTVYSNNLPNTLIVLPYSLIGQWEKIILKLFGISPLIFHGSNRKRLTEDQIKFHPIVLTTYGLISDIKNKKPMNVYDYENLLYNIKWDRVIYDEAHHLRNKATKVNIGARKVKSDIIWLMTGTPIQNSEKDLYTLFGLLGIKANKDNVETLIQEYMLRRTKEKAGIKLPPCHSSFINVKWNFIEEKNLSERIHAKLKFSNMTNGPSEAGPRGAGPSEAGPSELQIKIISKAKKMCALPKLLNKNHKRRLILVDEEGSFIRNLSPAKIFKQEYQASKVNSVVKTVLSKKDNGRPKLIFCYFHGEIDELYIQLTKKGMHVKKFDGRTSKKERASILSETCEVLIGQIDATNEGLNLQAYKEVYIVSPQWNPAIEDQAIARCHRIGQTDEIDVYRFIMNGFNDEDTITLDQYIINVQERKRGIIRKLLVVE